MNRSEPLNPERIRQGLQTAHIGRCLLVFEEVSSTNDIIWDSVGSPDADGLCVFAEKQTAGRGRRGRIWHGTAGQSLLFSILLKGEHLSADLLVLASAVAVAQTLSALSVSSVQIKWPNDILVAGKKVCGILCESKTIHSQGWFVVGIGINVCQERPFFEQYNLADSATSLALEADEPIDRSCLAASLLNALDHWFSISRYAPQQVIEVWKRYNRQIGSQIRILENQREFCGTCLDIDPAKGLLVQLHHGPVRFFHAANCTVIPFETAL
ncbi:MAG TPA: biotin--[acetyl-CoA-carboxylase] ligase [Anaerohalosphaeraceae bacterium]|nr:biotin--[acetyl-CoA-carboxylase] ligase [Anaerohalosphaeraceae bacterium]HOL88922.1 biotin--[acetyl-CoA-carboxylase] ligase [Anaerohalosphaeraceae bacterium]